MRRDGIRNGGSGRELRYKDVVHISEIRMWTDKRGNAFLKEDWYNGRKRKRKCVCVCVCVYVGDGKRACLLERETEREREVDGARYTYTHAYTEGHSMYIQRERGTSF